MFAPRCQHYAAALRSRNGAHQASRRISELSNPPVSAAIFFNCPTSRESIACCSLSRRLTSCGRAGGGGLELLDARTGDAGTGVVAHGDDDEVGRCIAA